MAEKTPNFQWRDGRPRWCPGPTVRAQGFQPQDLKDREGNWLTRPQAVAKAMELNQLVKSGGQQPVVKRARTMAALFDAVRDSPKMKGKTERDSGAKKSPAEKLKLAGRTRQGYRMHMKLLEAWCGDTPVAALTPAEIEFFYFAMAEKRGLAMANASLRVLKLCLNYARKKLRWIDFNPCEAVDMAATDGRLVFFSPEEFQTMVAAADYAGLYSMGDAVTLAALTGQRKSDLLPLAEGDLQGALYIITPRKTARSSGRRAYVPVTSPLRARLDEMRKRKRAANPDVVHTLELIATRTGAPYHPGGKEFDEEFRFVRALASGAIFAIEDLLQIMAGQEPRPRNLPFTPIAALLDKHFADFRDTAVTWLFIAGCTEAEIANITAHSLATVKTILNDHYLVRNEALSEGARTKFEAFLLARNIGG